MGAAKEPPPGPSPSGAPAAAAGGGWLSSFMKGPQGKALSSFGSMVKDKVGKVKMAMPVDVKVDFL